MREKIKGIKKIYLYLIKVNKMTVKNGKKRDAVWFELSRARNENFKF
jgi:hypothetical protein